MLFCVFLAAPTALAQSELVTSGSFSPSTSLVTPKGPDYLSKVEIQIEEVCLGRPGMLPTGFSTPPSIQITPFFGQHFNKAFDVKKGEYLTDPINLNDYERLSEKEVHGGHYVFKDLKVTTTLLDVFDKLRGTSGFYPQTDDDTGESSIEFYGVNLSVKSGLNHLVGSRWAFNGDDSTRLGNTSSRLLESDPITGDMTRLNTLWPNTGVLVNTSRRFVTTNEGFFGAFNHKHHNEHPVCDRSPFIIYSVKKTPGQ